MTATVITLDCRLGMSTMPEKSVDAIVTDPPYGLSKQPNAKEVLRHWLNGDEYSPNCGGFMGKTWDSFVPGPLAWEQALRVLKPGGYLVAFAGSRTQDLMAMALRLAGFEVLDTLFWLYGSGMPKSLAIDRAIDKAEGAERPIVGVAADRRGDGSTYGLGMSGALRSRTAQTEDAKKWVGFGTGLKPCYEPIILCRRPLQGTYVNNVLTHGVGALNIDGCRVGDELRELEVSIGVRRKSQGVAYGEKTMTAGTGEYVAGRWPTNIAHDGCLPPPMDRYFYSAKATKADREAGLGNFKHHDAGTVTGGRTEGSAGINNGRAGAGRTSGGKNTHPTVKPTELMRWLCRLVTPPGGTILDPFTGSGSTGRGVVLEGFNFIGFELSEEYAEIARARIADAEKERNA